MTLILLALSISLDSLALGVSYGIRKIKVSKVAFLVIVLMSLASLSASWFAGRLLLSVLSVDIAKIISSILLILFGAFLLVQALLDNIFHANDSHRLIKKVRIKSLKLVIDIIREPASSDMDHSGVIDIREALYIGAALSIDALSVGLAAAAFVVKIIPFLLCTAAMNMVLLKAGELAGGCIKRFARKERLMFLSGGIVLLVGVLKLI